MARQQTGQTSFSAGELSPRLWSRTQAEEFSRGLKELTNALVSPHGPLKRRSGTIFVAQSNSLSSTARLIPYKTNTSERFMLEFSDLKIRFFTALGQIVESDKTITNITQANPAVVSSTAHGYSTGDHVYITGVNGMTQINSNSIAYRVGTTTANTFQVLNIDGTNVNSTGYSAYTSGGIANRIYQITSPYSISQVGDIQYYQQGLDLYIVHPDVAVQVLTQITATTFSITAVTFSPPYTYEAGYAPTTTLTPAATSGTNVNFTAGAATFLEGDIGRQLINLAGAGRAAIIGITSTTVVVCDIIEAFPSTSAIASGDWKIDLSPVVDLQLNGQLTGQDINIRPEFPTGSLGPRLTITGITQANPGVVTSTAHGLGNGMTVILNDIVGMTQLNGRVFTVAGVTANTFQLLGENTSGYTAYTSGGIIRRRLENLAVDAFRSVDVGKYILINGGVLKIVSVNSAQDVDAEIIKSLNGTDTSGIWSLEVEAWTADRGYPSVVSFDQQRLLLGSTDTEPEKVVGSEIGLPTSFGFGPDEEDAIDFECPGSGTLSWIAPGRDLTIGSPGGEFTAASPGQKPISPENAPNVKKITEYTSDKQVPIVVRNEILFVQGTSDIKRKIRSFRYDFNIDSYQGDDLTFLCEHMTEDGLTKMVYSQEPESLLYAITEEGNLVVGAYDREKKVLGFSKYDTDGWFEDIAVISSNGQDEVWCIIKRLINGVEKRYIETFTYYDGLDDTDGFADSYIIKSIPLTVSDITLANPAVVTSTAHGLSNGDTVVIKGIVDVKPSEQDSSKTNLSAINGYVFTVANKTANTFELSGFSTLNYNDAYDYGTAYKRQISLTGLQHLEGKSVYILGDGGVQANKTISSGAVTLDTYAGEVVIGLPYTTTITTLDSDFDSGTGTMYGQRSRWCRPTLHVYRSTAPLVNGDIIPTRLTSDPMGVRTPLFTGFYEYGPQEWGNSLSLTITIDEPLPCQLTSITGTIESGIK